MILIMDDANTVFIQIVAAPQIVAALNYIHKWYVSVAWRKQLNTIASWNKPLVLLLFEGGSYLRAALINIELKHEGLITK